MLLGGLTLSLSFLAKSVMGVLSFMNSEQKEMQLIIETKLHLMQKHPLPLSFPIIGPSKVPCECEKTLLVLS